MSKKYLAEFIGTFALAFTVLVAIVYVDLPLLAAIIVGLFVYSIGPISGCHINPAVTLAQLSVKKISIKEATGYIVAQFLGALVAVLLSGIFRSELALGVEGVFGIKPFIAEIIGAFFFNFGIASVVYGKAKEQMSGLVIGGSLFFGILVASWSGSMGILNPAVGAAVTYGSTVPLAALYIVAPIIGAVLGFQVYRFLVTEKQM